MNWARTQTKTGPWIGTVLGADCNKTDHKRPVIKIMRKKQAAMIKQLLDRLSIEKGAFRVHLKVVKIRACFIILKLVDSPNSETLKFGVLYLSISTNFGELPQVRLIIRSFYSVRKLTPFLFFSTRHKSFGKTRTE